MNNNATRNRPLTARYEPEITIGPHDGDIRGEVHDTINRE